MSLNRVALLGYVLLCTSCAAPPANESRTSTLAIDFARVEQLGWAPLNLEGAGCPDLNGKFSVWGDRFLVTSDDYGAALEKRDGRALPDALLRNAPAQRLPAAEPESLQVRHHGGEIHSTAVVAGPHPYTAAATYRQSSGDFICQGGLVHLRGLRSAGYSDGSQSNYAEATQIGRLRDGSLVVGASTVSSSTSMLMFRTVRHTVEYVRFTRSSM
jgi:hypothetical protein